MFEKIQKYIRLFNCISRVRIDTYKVIVTFECRKDLDYNNLFFKLIFINPYIFRLPYCDSGQYEIELIENLEQQTLIEKEYPKGNKKVYVIRNKNNNVVYYVLCDDIDYKISGLNYHIKSEKELLID
jgi:hypothetical protein